MKIKKLVLFSIATLFSGLLLLGCGTGSSSSTSGNSEPAPPPTVETTSTSAFIQIEDGQSAFNTRFSGTLDNVGWINITVKNGTSIVASDNLTLSGGSWSGTLDNLTIGVPLNFIAKAYDANKILLFTVNTQQTLATSGNTVSLYLMPVDDGTANTFPQVTKIVYPHSMNTSDNATFQIFITGQTNERFPYAMTNGGGSFTPQSGTFRLSGTSGVLSLNYTAPSSVPASGSVTHTFKITNTQNNSVEQDLSTTITTPSTVQTPNTATVQMTTAFAPVITGLTAKRIGNAVAWTAQSSPSNNLTYAWNFNSKNFCNTNLFDNATGSCTGTTANSNAEVMTPYASTDHGTLTLTIQGTGTNPNVTASYQVQAGMFPDLVDAASRFSTIQFGTFYDDTGRSVAIDSTGNIYVTGDTFGSLGGYTNAGGGSDVFLVKYNRYGVKQWTRQFGTFYNDFGLGVTVDASGNIYVVGGTSGNLDGNVSAGASDMFLVKYSSSGVKQWTQQFGTSSVDYGRSIVLDSANNIYISGTTSGALDNNTRVGGIDIFLVKYSSSGMKQWTQQFGTSSLDFPRGVAVDTTGNIYVTGDTGGSLDGTTNGGTDTFLVKYNTSGVKQWIQQFGSFSGNSVGNDSGYGVAVDLAGNTYITGRTYGNLDNNISSGFFDIFLTKYSSSGVKQWTKQLGTSGSDYGYSVAVDAMGDIYVTGDTAGNLGGNTNGGADIFLVKYHTSGVKQWTRQVGSSTWDTGYDVALDAFGNAYITGQTNGSLDNQSNAGGNDVFITEYSPDGEKGVRSVTPLGVQ